MEVNQRARRQLDYLNTILVYEGGVGKVAVERAGGGRR